jgi:hypothetical protein
MTPFFMEDKPHPLRLFCPNRAGTFERMRDLWDRSSNEKLWQSAALYEVIPDRWLDDSSREFFLEPSGYGAVRPASIWDMEAFLSDIPGVLQVEELAHQIERYLGIIESRKIRWSSFGCATQPSSIGVPWVLSAPDPSTWRNGSFGLHLRSIPDVHLPLGRAFMPGYVISRGDMLTENWDAAWGLARAALDRRKCPYLDSAEGLALQAVTAANILRPSSDLWRAILSVFEAGYMFYGVYDDYVSLGFPRFDFDPELSKYILRSPA